MNTSQMIDWFRESFAWLSAQVHGHVNEAGARIRTDLLRISSDIGKIHSDLKWFRARDEEILERVEFIRQQQEYIVAVTQQQFDTLVQKIAILTTVAAGVAETNKFLNTELIATKDALLTAQSTITDLQALNAEGLDDAEQVAALQAAIDTAIASVSSLVVATSDTNVPTLAAAVVENTSADAGSDVDSLEDPAEIGSSDVESIIGSGSGTVTE